MGVGGRGGICGGGPPCGGIGPGGMTGGCISAAPSWAFLAEASAHLAAAAAAAWAGQADVERPAVAAADQVAGPEAQAADRPSVGQVAAQAVAVAVAAAMSDQDRPCAP